MWMNNTYYMVGQLFAKTKQLVGLDERKVSVADPQATANHA
jgi:hypothetical protein